MGRSKKHALTDSPSHGSLVIVGRRWFDRVNGNTYHTAEIIVNGQSVHRTGRAYGYGEQYVESAAVWLEQEGYIKREQHANGSHEPLWRYCADRKIAFTYFAVDLPKKGDLE